MFAGSVFLGRKSRLDFGGGFAEEEDEAELELEAEYTFHRSFSVEVGVPLVRLDRSPAPPWAMWRWP